MFRLDLESNTIKKVEQRTFGSLSMTERNHLQEWIAGSPECLGEELLIIQKEFDGFDDTRERLDLLALDKDGRVVVIENKLDDSGRDVVWQALKYASYCAALTSARIVDIFRDYLQANEIEDDPEELIAEFLEVGDLSETTLNPGSEQRIILTSGSFRREVTSTVLWLLKHQVDIRCVRATPYKLNEEILLNFEPIIPVPETADFMIGISKKDAEQSAASGAAIERYKMRREFWTLCLKVLRASEIDLFENINPGKEYWLSAGSGIRSCPYQLIFGKRDARVQIEFARTERSENKALFDALFAKREAIEEHFGAALDWQRYDSGKSSRVQFQAQFDGYNRDNWDEIIEWQLLHLGKFLAAINGFLHQEAASLFDG